MKKIVILVSFLFYNSINAQNTFEMEYFLANSFSYNIEEIENSNYLMIYTSKKDSIYQLNLKIINSKGEEIKNKLLIQKENIIYDIDKIYTVNDGYLAFGTRTFLNLGNKMDLVVFKLDKNLLMIDSLYYFLTPNLSILPLDVKAEKGIYYIASSLINNNLYPYPFIGKIDFDKKNIEIKMLSELNGKNVWNVLPIKENLILQVDAAELMEFNESLQSTNKVGLTYPFDITQGDLVKLSDSTYLIGGRYLPDDLGIQEYIYPFKKSKKKFTFGKKDTMDYPGLYKFCVVSPNKNVYISGNSNFYLLSNDNPSWIVINNLYPDYKLHWQKYFGGDANYTITDIIATSDGGCLLYGEKYYYNTDKKTTLYLLKLNVQGQLVSSDGIVQETNEVKIFPNPSRDNINISIAQKDELFDLQCIDSQGKVIYSCEMQHYHSLDVSNWQAGIYVFILRDKKGNLAKMERVIVK